MHRNQLSVYALLIILFLISACSKSVYEFDPAKAVYYPPPPDTTRIQFLTSFSNSTDIVKQRSGLARFLLGELPVEGIIKPHGIAAEKGKIYICDSDLGGLEVIDLGNKSFEYFIPKGKGKLSKPFNCCLDSAGNIYITDGIRQQVIVFNNDRKFLDAFGEPDDFKPTDIAISDSLVFVVNLDGNEVVVYRTATYEKLYSFPDADPGQDEYLYSPLNIYVNDKIVYVSDIGDSKVKKFSLDGTFINSFGSVGRRPGQFVRIKGLAADNESNLYAVDAAFENVQVFNKNDQLLMFFGGSTKERGGMWLPAKVAIDYKNTEYFQDYVDPEYNLEYLIYVTNQFGSYKVNVYGFVKPKILENK